jgi:hypothetical protein
VKRYGGRERTIGVRGVRTPASRTAGKRADSALLRRYLPQRGPASTQFGQHPAARWREAFVDGKRTSCKA